MPISPDTMRALLFLCILGSAILAILYLRQRSLSTEETLRWGILIFLVPILGPFLVILARPGKPRN
jgi:hypothetical protein